MTTETTTTPGPGGITPGRAAYEAWAAILTGRGTWNVPTGTWEELPDAIRDACDAAAKAAMMQISPELRATLAERDEARAKLAQAERCRGCCEALGIGPGVGTPADEAGKWRSGTAARADDLRPAGCTESPDGFDEGEWGSLWAEP